MPPRADTAALRLPEHLARMLELPIVLFELPMMSNQH